VIGSHRIPIGPPRLEIVKNLTPFPHFQIQKMAPGRRFFDTVVVKGTFTLGHDGLALAGRQAPIVCADRYRDRANAARSSLEHAGEVVLAKPGTDVIVTGTARSPGGKALTEWDCSVVVRGRTGTVLRHSLQVTGPRSWVFRALRGWTLTDPGPAVGVPVRYELAYGGAYPDPRGDPASPRWIVHSANPSGTGFLDEAGLDRSRAHPGPQWQLHAHPVTAPNREAPLAGLGPVARTWSSRYRFAGTYDRAWSERAREDAARGLVPDYPADFDLRFFQCAHPALWTTEPLAGDEHVGLSGLLGGPGDAVTQLPGLRLPARLLSGEGQWHDLVLPLDTVHIDLDAALVHLSWRLTLGPERDIRAAVIACEGETLHG
jgi:hypothetical protein